MNRSDYFIGFLFEGKIFLLARPSADGNSCHPIRFKDLQEAESFLDPLFQYVYSGHQHSTQSLQAIQLMESYRPKAFRCPANRFSSSVGLSDTVVHDPMIERWFAGVLVEVGDVLLQYQVIDYFEMYQQMQNEWRQSQMPGVASSN